MIMYINSHLDRFFKSVIFVPGDLIPICDPDYQVQIREFFQLVQPFSYKLFHFWPLLSDRIGPDCAISVDPAVSFGIMIFHNEPVIKINATYKLFAISYCFHVPVKEIVRPSDDIKCLLSGNGTPPHLVIRSSGIM